MYAMPDTQLPREHRTYAMPDTQLLRDYSRRYGRSCRRPYGNPNLVG